LEVRPRAGWLAGLFVAALWAMGSLAQAATAADVEQRIRNEIATSWKVQDLQVNVTPYTQAHSDQGLFKSVMVRAEVADISGIVVRPVYVKATDVTFDMGLMMRANPVIRTRSRGDTEVHLELYQDDLNEGLRRAQSVVPDLTATLSSGQITLTGTYKFIWGNKFRMSGRLAAPDGYKINFIPTAAKVNGIPIPVSGVKLLLSKLNPLLDLSNVIMKPKVNTLTIEDGKLIAQ
jgi:hypothetical protein